MGKAEKGDVILQITEKVKACNFDLDKEGNMEKSKKLLDAKIGMEQKLYKIEHDYRKARSEVMLSDKIQGVKTNEATREAIIELELIDRFKVRDEYRYILKVIDAVCMHNNDVLDMFFRKDV